MCTGMELVALAGTVVSTAATVHSYNQQQEQAEENARLEREAADEQAKRVRMAVEREKSAARAATAASGTQLDEFASINIDAIERLGASDEAMTRLSGARRARREMQSAENYGNAAMASGFAGFASMAGTAAKSNWRTTGKGQ